jgi:hypothetical protein
MLKVKFFCEKQEKRDGKRGISRRVTCPRQVGHAGLRDHTKISFDKYLFSQRREGAKKLDNQV